MTSTEQRGIPPDRIHGPSSVNIDPLACIICHDVLWKPVACQSCETPFCATCISQWLANNPNRCPNRCEGYMERKCPPFIAKLLAQLQIACFFQSNGCDQIIAYEALDKHEIECDYQLQLCSGCKSPMVKKDLVQHERDCPLIEWTCEYCTLVYKRDDVAKHTDNICLKEQLRQLRDQSKQNREELRKMTTLWNRLCTLDPEFTKVTIKFDDLPSATQECKIIFTTYRGLQWTGIYYGHQFFLNRNYPTSGYVTCFIAGFSPHVAYFKTDASITVDRPEETFTLVSVSVCAAWNDDLHLTITGHRNSEQINAHRTTLRFGQPQLIHFQWKNINKISFRPFGGTAHPGSGQVAMQHVIITQLTIDPLH